MSKETSLMLKGVAILMMIFLHLFAKSDIVNNCHPLLFIGGKPLVTLLTHSCLPVGFFLLLSGYGLHYLYVSGRDIGPISQVKRLLKLYIAYWFILLIFVSIGSYVNPEIYPGNLQKIIGNVVSWENSYNFEHWFLFFYALLSLTSLYLFKIVDRLGNLKAFLLFCPLYFVTPYIISRHIAPAHAHHTVFAKVITYLELSFTFVLGALFHRINDKRGLKIKFFEGKKWLVVCLILSLVTIKCFISTGAIDFIFILAYIILFLQINISKLTSSILMFFGKYSMIMWLTHSFFCYYLFQKFIYSFDRPILIFIILVAITTSVSIPIKFCVDRIVKAVGL